jgi:hypothetical protein
MSLLVSITTTVWFQQTFTHHNLKTSFTDTEGEGEICEREREREREREGRWRGREKLRTKRAWNLDEKRG